MGSPAESCHVRLGRQVIQRIDAVAAREHRSRANMIFVLILEALRIREWIHENGAPAPSNLRILPS